MNLEELSKKIRDINLINGWNVVQEKDWEDVYKIPAILALIHSEVSEALEAFRNGDIVNFREELADTLIRVLDLSGGIKDMNMDKEVENKLETNKKRGYKHGNKKV